jgi:hypothetical protein
MINNNNERFIVFEKNMFGNDKILNNLAQKISDEYINCLNCYLKNCDNTESFCLSLSINFFLYGKIHNKSTEKNLFDIGSKFYNIEIEDVIGFFIVILQSNNSKRFNTKWDSKNQRVLLYVFQ